MGKKKWKVYVDCQGVEHCEVLQVSFTCICFSLGDDEDNYTYSVF